MVPGCGLAQARVSPGLHLRFQPGLPIHWAPALSPAALAPRPRLPTSRCRAHLGGLGMGLFEAPGPEQTWPQVNPLAQPRPKPTPPPPLQTKLNRKQNGGSSSSGLPPRAKPLQPRDSLSAAGSTPARQGVGSSREPGAAALEQRVRARDSALRSPRPLTHHPFPSPFPLPSPSPGRAVRGERLRGAGSGDPPRGTGRRTVA